jgi:hypothetical protein
VFEQGMGFLAGLFLLYMNEENVFLVICGFA